MKTLKQQLGLINDLRRQREVMAFRYYTSDNQSTLLDLILAEIGSWPNAMKISEELFIKLSNPEKLATDTIDDLCHIYREVIIRKNNLENIKSLTSSNK